MSKVRAGGCPFVGVFLQRIVNVSSFIILSLLVRNTNRGKTVKLTVEEQHELRMILKKQVVTV